jgi:hypothetical protein
VEATGPVGASGKAVYLFAVGYQAGGGFSEYIENMEQEN